MKILAQEEPAADVDEGTLNSHYRDSTGDALTLTAAGIILFFVIGSCVFFMKFIHRQKSAATLAKERKEHVIK